MSASNNSGKNDNKNIKNEIDWKIIDQLHNATNNFTKTSLELKKLMFAVIGISLPIVISLNKNKLNGFIFFVLCVCIVFFWLYDSYTYYYQELLREKMNNKFIELNNRNERESKSRKIENNFTLPPNRNKKKRICRSLFNLSNIFFYGMLILFVIFGFIFYE